MEQMNHDIGNNTNNTNDEQIPNIDNSQDYLENDKKSTDQCSHEPAIYEDINRIIGLQNKSSNYNILEDNITTLKADMIAMKTFMMQKIFNNTQRMKTVEMW